jgi:branched-chain amino acid transport system substrate-binding protein
MKSFTLAFSLMISLGLAPVAYANGVKIGITIAETGPAASLGIPQQKTVSLLPKEVSGQKIEYLVLDDGSDPTKAVENARKLAADENADAIVGSSISPSSIALVEVASELKVPLIARRLRENRQPNG